MGEHDSSVLQNKNKNESRIVALSIEDEQTYGHVT